MIYTDDSSGGAGDCNEGENYKDVFSALEVLRQPCDYRNVDRYQGREHTLSQPSASLIRSALDTGSLYACNVAHTRERCRREAGAAAS